MRGRGAPGDEPETRGRLRRYVLFQIPGALLFAALLGWGVEREWVSLRTAALLWVIWVAKDAVLYPALRVAYGPDRDDPGKSLRGREGVARDSLAPDTPEGYVALGPELWRATLAPESRSIAPGDRVRVRAVRGMRLVVSRVEG